MEKDWLAGLLEQGRSIESIAREVGRDPSTVAYWVNKHGLVSAHAAKHAARGGMEQSELESMLAAGLSIRAMAARTGTSYSTVRHWLARHGLRTPRAQRLADTADARRDGAEAVAAICAVHGPVMLIRRGSDGFRCPECRREAVSGRRRRVKRLLVKEAGGACTVCGYERSVAALHFRHADPAAKAFAVSRHGVTRSLTAARAEATKCVLLCANCHAEVEAGVTVVR
jgi:lambda repressor-like predicted transcriptional regulator